MATSSSSIASTSQGNYVGMLTETQSPEEAWETLADQAYALAMKVIVEDPQVVATLTSVQSNPETFYSIQHWGFPLLHRAIECMENSPELKQSIGKLASIVHRDIGTEAPFPITLAFGMQSLQNIAQELPLEPFDHLGEFSPRAQISNACTRASELFTTDIQVSSAFKALENDLSVITSVQDWIFPLSHRVLELLQNDPKLNGSLAFLVAQLAHIPGFKEQFSLSASDFLQKDRPGLAQTMLERVLQLIAKNPEVQRVLGEVIDNPKGIRALQDAFFPLLQHALDILQQDPELGGLLDQWGKEVLQSSTHDSRLPKQLFKTIATVLSGLLDLGQDETETIALVKSLETYYSQVSTLHLRDPQISSALQALHNDPQLISHIRHWIFPLLHRGVQLVQEDTDCAKSFDLLLSLLEGSPSAQALIMSKIELLLPPSEDGSASSPDSSDQTT